MKNQIGTQTKVIRNIIPQARTDTHLGVQHIHVQITEALKVQSHHMQPARPELYKKPQVSQGNIKFQVNKQTNKGH